MHEWKKGLGNFYYHEFTNGGKPWKFLLPRMHEFTNVRKAMEILDYRHSYGCE
jgi:hypothetical protein